MLTQRELMYIVSPGGKWAGEKLEVPESRTRGNNSAINSRSVGLADRRSKYQRSIYPTDHFHEEINLFKYCNTIWTDLVSRRSSIAIS